MTLSGSFDQSGKRHITEKPKGLSLPCSNQQINCSRKAFQNRVAIDKHIPGNGAKSPLVKPSGSEMQKFRRDPCLCHGSLGGILGQCL